MSGGQRGNFKTKPPPVTMGCESNDPAAAARVDLDHAHGRGSSRRAGICAPFPIRRGRAVAMAWGRMRVGAGTLALWTPPLV